MISKSAIFSLLSAIIVSFAVAGPVSAVALAHPGSASPPSVTSVEKTATQSDTLKPMPVKLVNYLNQTFNPAQWLPKVIKLWKEVSSPAWWARVKGNLAKGTLSSKTP